MQAKIYHIILIALLMLFPKAVNAQINTDQMMRIGQNALYFEDYILSIQYFNQVIQAKPYMATPYLMRAIAKINLDDYRGAEADASKAIELNPFLTDAWEVRGVARQNLNRDLEAISDYQKALELLPRNRNIMFNLAMAQSDVEQYDQADSTYQQLLSYYPNFDNGYLGRAKLLLARNDTVAASADIDKALAINPNALNGYLMRAGIAIEQKSDLPQALADMDKALTLQPRLASLYINRAFLRYSLEDYFGAMADYDYALELEPYNTVALFNRSLLLMEVSDNDRALSDLDRILQLEPDEYRARFNRAVVQGEKRNYDQAIADLDVVIQRFPELASAYYLRSQYYREKNNLSRAKADYDMADRLSRREVNVDNPAAVDNLKDETPEEASKRFNTLLTIAQETNIDQEYNNTAIRGRIQDNDINIELEPYMELSYYSAPNELKPNSYYIKEVDDINSTRMLRFLITVETHAPVLNDPDMIQQHFNSIDYYNSYISTHTPRAIDYLGRALDMITVKNYDGAIADLDRALQLTPDNPVAYMLRAQARYKQSTIAQDHSNDNDLPRLSSTNQLTMALADIDQALQISPRNAIAWYDKGYLLFLLGDYTSALASFNKAIELVPEMGEAYFNRGYVHMKLGNQKAGIADLSKAGELGIASAYNLIKRISKVH